MRIDKTKSPIAGTRQGSDTSDELIIPDLEHSKNGLTLLHNNPMPPASIKYAKHGFAVFPLHTPDFNCAEPRCSCGFNNCMSIGKHPRTRNGLKDATKSIQQVKKYWKMWPKANIGMATGKVSGVVVLDVDNIDSLIAFEKEHGELPDGPGVVTGSGGLHIYFKASDERIPNSASKLGPGLDVRGDGGYVVLPPSLHVSGNRYEWVESWRAHLG
jgi:hypothetical protein